MKFLTLLTVALLFTINSSAQKVPGSKRQRSATETTNPANAGPDIVSYVGEPVRLDGSASKNYSLQSQLNGTPSIVWEFGDGTRTEHLLKPAHAYLGPGVYTARLTVVSSTGVRSSDTAIVRVLPFTSSNSITLIDTQSAEINRQNLQAALEQAAVDCRLNEILVPAGFIANDPITVPARNCTNYVTVRVADLSNLPENVRVTRADAPKLFKINARSASISRSHQAISISPNANYFRFIGVWIERSGDFKNDIIAVDTYSLSQPSHMIFDRVLIDGNGTETNRAFAPNGRYFSLLNSSILNIKAIGYESKAIGQWRGNGPLVVVNNRLEAASINSLIGGATVTSADQVLDGFDFRSNHVWKSPDWVVADGVGKGYGVKNLFELKCGYNVSAIGNVFENNYQDGQSGEAILIKSSAQPEESNMYAEVRGLDFRNNKILNTRAGFNVNGLQSWISPHPPYANHIFFTNNFWQERSGRGNLILTPDYFEINHNTFVGSPDKGSWAAIDLSYPEMGSRRGRGLKILNSVIFNGVYGAIFSSYGGGMRALDYGFEDWDVRGNLFSGVIPNAYPSGNYFDESTASTGTDGLPVGANMSLLETETRVAMTGSFR